MKGALNEPRAARVRIGAQGVPARVDGRAVGLVRECWLVEDRWWTQRPLRRRYWELLSDGGRNMVVFEDLCAPPGGARWFSQRP
ncbi:MAG TPA: hypothetical protein VGX51_13880 [Solirubrobacteraceae bacterium]|jgi:hypothetical protein|nr:hypothetical protein [Solirubrobacteraceae bacterium]